MYALILNSISFILVLLTASIFTERPAFRLECDSDEFSCSTRQKSRGMIHCIKKRFWCDGTSGCPNNEDEEYCNGFLDYGNCDGSMYRCPEGICIPKSGRCDGFFSCQEGSDEENCPCKIVNANKGIIPDRETEIHRKCWKIRVQPNKYLILDIGNLLSEEACYRMNLTLKVKNLLGQETSSTLCPERYPSTERTIEAFNDVTILYRTGERRDRSAFDSFRINYSIEDILCKRNDSFKCSPESCILPEKQCDGVQDCTNGMDEKGCRNIAAINGTGASRKLGLAWLMQQRNAAWGWRENTHRAVTALYLANGASFNGTNKDEALIAKQLELQMSTAILRNGTDKISPTQLAMFINSLLVICHDPRNFYGFNLVNDLEKLISSSSDYVYPLSYLALCNAKGTVSKTDIDKLFEILKTPPKHGIMLDIHAAAVLALSCITNDSAFAFLKTNVTQVTKLLKEQQMDDGSFGSKYTTAIIMQALLANGHELDEDWDLESTIKFLMQKQSSVDGSFGDFLSTYLILPLLNAKTLVDVGRVNCSMEMRMPRDGNPVSDIEYKLGPKISILYYLYIGDEKDQIHPIMLRTTENATVLEVMRLAAGVDPKYKFLSHNIMGKSYVYELSGIPNDPEDGKFWHFYTSSANSTAVFTFKSPEDVIVNDGEKIIMWYKTAKVKDFKEIAL